MKAPRAGYGKEFAVRWLNIGNDEVMYSGAMTEEAANHLAMLGHWHRRASPSVVKLREETPISNIEQSNAEPEAEAASK